MSNIFPIGSAGSPRPGIFGSSRQKNSGRRTGTVLAEGGVCQSPKGGRVIGRALGNLINAV